MESARDTIKYVKPVYTKPFKKDAKGGNMGGTHFSGDADPYEIEKSGGTREDGYGDINRDGYRRAMYERTDGERFSNDLWNLPYVTDGADGKFNTFQAGDDGKKIDGGLPYIDGYTTIYVVVNGKEVVLAIQDKVSKSFFTTTGLKNEKGKDTGITVTPGAVGSNEITVAFAQAGDGETGGAPVVNGKTLALTDIKAYGLFNSEEDWDGDFLGEVDIQFSDYEFNPRRTAIGVSWSTLSEIVLDTSFNVSAEEFLITYASQEIRVALDNRALKLAYATARSNGSKYTVRFDARYSAILHGENGDVTNAGAKDGYIDNAQTLPTAIAALGDIIYNDIDFSVAA